MIKKKRRHHNNKGLQQIKKDKTNKQVECMVFRLWLKSKLKPGDILVGCDEFKED